LAWGRCPDRDRGISLRAIGGCHAVTAPTWSAYADKLTAGGDSVLARLAEDELASGLEAVHQYANLRDTHREPVAEPIDIFFFR
jgi:hypothetical protein